MEIRGTARVSVTVLLALLIGACDSGPTHPIVQVLPSGQAGPPASLAVTAITGVGTSITLTAHVRDANGRGVPDQRVDLETTSGVIDPATVTTKGDGIATTALFSNQKATVTARLGDLRAEPLVVDGLSRFQVRLGVSSTGTRGIAIGITVRVEPFERAMTYGAASLDFGDGTSTPLTFTPDSLGATLTHTYYQPRDFTVVARVSDSLGMTEQASSTITIVNPVPPPPPPSTPAPTPSYSVTLAGPSTIVAGTPAAITATVTPLNGATAPTSYAWDCNNDGTVDATTAVPATTCTYTAAGSITTQVRVTGAGASGTGVATFTVLAGLVVTVDCVPGVPGASTGCTAGATYAGTALPSAAIANVTWDWGDSHVDTAVPGAVAAHIYPIGSVYTVTATATATTVDGSKTGTGSKSITVH
jgi:hypothetical protein